MRQYELIEQVKSYQPNADEDALIRAYILASKVHYDQRRESGEPYFYHPISVAQILLDYKMDADTIIAALLHDTVEDTPTAYKDIETLFGHDVAELVEGVTKLNQIQLQDETEKQAQNFQELVLATSKDIRILMIKMADRLHNMRTLFNCKSAEKRHRISNETLSIYVPLAERIGLHKIKIEMEDLCFQNLHPETYQDITHQLEAFVKKGKNSLASLIKIFKKLMDENRIKSEVLARQKTPYSIWKKLQTHDYTMEEIFDLIGIRILVKTIPECYKVLGILHTHFHAIPGNRFKDYISNPKDSGYRSLHTCIIGPHSQRLEIQIRTFEMDKEANFGIVAHWQYKQGFHIDTKQYEWMQELLELIKSAKNPKEFLEHTKMALYQDKIFLFTEKGKLYSLKKGSTILDFAYLQSTELGNACVGAYVNGHKENENYPLKNGQSVRLILNKKKQLTPDTLNNVLTASARAAILTNLRQQENKKIYNEVLQKIKKETENAHLTFDEAELNTLAKKLRYKKLTSLLLDIHHHKISIHKILTLLHPNMKSSLYQKTLDLIRQWAQKPQTAAIVGLKASDKFTLASCCHPVVGDAIIAIETGKNHYTIHTRDCATLSKYKRFPEKWVAVEWNLSNNKNKQPARLKIVWKTGPSTMGQIIALLNKEKVQIIRMTTMDQSDKLTEIMADIQVKNNNHLKQVIQKLLKHPKITSVQKESGS